ncbi:MAG: hypothetical protein K6E59_04780 [Bacilli bacterium]|nr:hypothetical protein [Bacilli bacterium]
MEPPRKLTKEERAFFLAEEEKYSRLLSEALLSSPLCPKDKAHQKRMMDELSRLHQLLQCKTVYLAHKIAEALIKQEVPFYTSGRPLGLYVFYVLGIIKMDPAELGCPIEMELGIESEPPTPFSMTFYVAEEDRKEVCDVIVHIDPGSHVFHTDIHSSERLNLGSFCLISKQLQEDHFLRRNGTSTDGVASVTEAYEDSFLYCHRFVVVQTREMRQIRTLIRECGKGERSFELFLKALKNEDFLPRWQLTVLENFEVKTFADACYAEEMSSRLAEERQAGEAIFKDRDEVFLFFRSLGIDAQKSLTLATAARKGRFKRLYGEDAHLKERIPQDKWDDLCATHYLGTRMDNAERVYTYMLLAYYEQNFPKAFARTTPRLPKR